MSVSLGFALRIGDFPPAAAMPPVSPTGHQVIDVKPEPDMATPVFRSSGMRTRTAAYFRDHSLTYSRGGQHSAPSESSGFLLDLFA